ncbi:hemin uptake protein HemP [Denitromonas iodatirespirans]|uniref:Hemin uptake protein HemP n=1 Tax=Denitromonas iodatirespirans TaxID=2795389 RepID=A0A944D7A1_DENI1|nr:hemin uptake protein HemP [Denitromonas iodatirespirans]MBT0959821.1 hemin uptake protein HemP [Denitromonas iodatirespirans]
MTLPRQPAPSAVTTEPLRTDDRASPAIASESLLKGRSVVTIEHKGISYRLQETRAGKLILTK